MELAECFPSVLGPRKPVERNSWAGIPPTKIVYISRRDNAMRALWNFRVLDFNDLAEEL